MRDRDSDSRGRGSRPTFRYQERDYESAKKRIDNAGSGNYDSFLPDTVKVFKAAAGDNTVRILPPTWEAADHYGLEVWVHYDVGPDRAAYLCLDKMRGKPCPVCEERKRAAAAGDTEYADTLKPAPRVLYYVLDRNKEREGAQVWSVGKRMDADILKVSVDREAGDVLAVDHPTKGYDLSFTREGEKMKTRYSGFQFARRPTSIDNDDALDHITAAPLPTLLRYYSYDHMESAFKGASERKGKQDDEDPPRRRASRDDDDAPPARASKRAEPEVTLTRAEIMDMTFRQLSNVVDRMGLKVDPSASRNDEELATMICEELGLEEAPRRRASRDETEEDPPRRRASRDEDEDPPPRRRASRDEPEEDPPRRRASRDEPEDEPPRRRASRDDDDSGSQTRTRLRGYASE